MKFNGIPFSTASAKKKKLIKSTCEFIAGPLYTIVYEAKIVCVYGWWTVAQRCNLESLCSFQPNIAYFGIMNTRLKTGRLLPSKPVSIHRTTSQVSFFRSYSQYAWPTWQTLNIEINGWICVCVRFFCSRSLLLLQFLRICYQSIFHLSPP